MILIIGQSGDYSVQRVIDWLLFYGKKFIFLDNEKKISLNYIKVLPDLQFELIIDDKFIVNSNDIESYFYRRGYINFLFEEKKVFSFLKNSNEYSLFFSMVEDKKVIFSFISNELEKKQKKIGCFKYASVNKLDILKNAYDLGIDIPNTIITQKKEILNDFYNYNEKKIISKSIDSCPPIWIDDKIFSSYTNCIDDKMINEINNIFYISLLQSNILKKYEIRSFYLKGKFYSIAIFSQLDKRTNQDFRRYNREKKHRTVPYKIPKNLENKIDKLMRKVGLDTGSIDIIYSVDKKYYFLEINPEGQYGMVSSSANYNLDKKIADYFI